MPLQLSDVTGFRGEKIVELCLTNYEQFPAPLFRPCFLGDKWPALDFYVELTTVRGWRPYFFVQAKSVTAPLAEAARTMRVGIDRREISRLLQIPGPTYLFGVHEPSQRVFVRSVHSRHSRSALTSIPVEYELTSSNLRRLQLEVRDYWRSITPKPTHSVFA